MSATIISYAVLGCEVTNIAPKNKEVRGCTHAETAAKFCAECGKPMRNTVRAYFEEWADETGLTDKLKLVGLKLCDTNDHRVFAGLMTEIGGSSNDTASLLRVDPTLTYRDSGPHQNTIARVIDLLSDLDLYDSATFGIWAVLYYS